MANNNTASIEILSEAIQLYLRPALQELAVLYQLKNGLKCMTL